MPSTRNETLDNIIVKPKRFQCNRCQRLFARLEHLQRHERTHTQERPFMCGQCDSRFTRSDLLIRHERLSHNRERGGPDSHPTQRETRPKRPKTSGGVPVGTLQEADTPMPRPGTPSPPLSASSSSSEVQREDSIENGEHAGFHSPVYRVLAAYTRQSSPGDLLDHTDHIVHTAFQPEKEPAVLPLLPPTPPSLAYPAASPTQPQDLAGGIPTPDNFPLEPKTAYEILSFPNENVAGESLIDFTTLLGATSPIPYQPHSHLLSDQATTPMFSFDSFLETDQALEGPGTNSYRASHAPLHYSQADLEEVTSDSHFGSRLPSVQPRSPDQRNHHPDPRITQHDSGLQNHHTKRLLYDLTADGQAYMAQKIAGLETVPQSFQLPTRLSLGRYIRGYINGFHEHLPFLHLPSMEIQTSAVELLLAMAAVGAQYCFEGEKGVELFVAARAIATERVRRRDARAASAQRQHTMKPVHLGSYSRSSAGTATNAASSVNRHVTGFTMGGLPLASLTLPANNTAFSSTSMKKEDDDLVQTAQALLILMAMATWGKHEEIRREATVIQGLLASLVREDGLRGPIHVNENSGETWSSWSRSESTLRTKYIVFCFFNLQSIVYNIPPLILNADLGMRLPSSAAEFKADTDSAWLQAKEGDLHCRPALFQDALRDLFPPSAARTDGQTHSSLANYILIHAIIQQIFLVRQAPGARFHESSDLSPGDVDLLERALQIWQRGWERSPDSSLDPMDNGNPVSFNSTALLRLAYIRLNVNTGPGRALDTRDPTQIAQALRNIPPVQRSSQLARAVLHSTQALSIPVNIGVRLVARTQTYIWSIQHSFCSLECALLLSKWLETVAGGTNFPMPLTADETTILANLKAMLEETEFTVSGSASLADLARKLNVGVLRVWASIFRGSQTWAIVDIIGTSLDLYADMMDSPLIAF